MEIIVTTGSRWKKVIFDVSDEVFEKIQQLAEKYGFRVEEAIKLILKGDFLEGPEGDIDTIKDEVSRLRKKLYKLEGKWSPLKFTSYGIAMDNRNLAI